MEERHAGVHERGAVAGVERILRRGGLQSRADAADGVGPPGGPGCGDSRGDHGGGRHVRLAAGGDDTASVEKGPDAVDGVSAVVEGGAERGGQGGHVVGGEGLVVRAEGVFEGVERVADFGPFGFGGAGGGGELLVFDRSICGDASVAAVVKAGRHADRAHVGHHTIHGRSARHGRLWWWHVCVRSSTPGLGLLGLLLPLL